MDEERIECKPCGGFIHSVQLHLREKHPECPVEDFKRKFPDSPLFSEAGKRKMIEAKEAMETLENEGSDSRLRICPGEYAMEPLYKVFGLRNSRDTKKPDGQPIQVKVYRPGQDSSDLVPEIDRAYVFNAEILQNCLMALEMDIPMYLWGHTGTGKTTVIEQCAARTNRPLIRVQHTVNTEESHITGQWTARRGETIFELGPLAQAMRKGWIYLADEYDFALPSVLAVYQPVLEGKPLVIKEADQNNRIIRRHQDFRFVATGNTNGGGDETGLYQGTLIQNAANFDRFHMVLEIDYMSRTHEINVVSKQAGISAEDSRKLVDFANRIRHEYDGNKVSTPISPRTLIAIANIAMMKGSFKKGIELAFSNKLSKLDREVVNGLAQRLFG